MVLSRLFAINGCFLCEIFLVILMIECAFCFVLLVVNCKVWICL